MDATAAATWANTGVFTVVSIFVGLSGLTGITTFLMRIYWRLGAMEKSSADRDRVNARRLKRIAQGKTLYETRKRAEIKSWTRKVDEARVMLDTLHKEHLENHGVRHPCQNNPPNTTERSDDKRP